MDKNINIQQILFFSVLKKPELKNKKIIDFIYSAIWLACKYGIIFQISIYNSTQNYIQLIFALSWVEIRHKKGTANDRSYV